MFNEIVDVFFGLKGLGLGTSFGAETSAWLVYRRSPFGALCEAQRELSCSPRGDQRSN